MPVVRRIFRMAGVDGLSVNGIKRALDAEGVPTPSGRKYWHWRAIQSFIMDDVYRPHDLEEVVDLVMPEVAATLNPGERYGVWWYNRQRVKRSQVSEAGPGGRIYRKRGKYSIKDRSEWARQPRPRALSMVAEAHRGRPEAREPPGHGRGGADHLRRTAHEARRPGGNQGTRPARTRLPTGSAGPPPGARTRQDGAAGALRGNGARRVRCLKPRGAPPSVPDARAEGERPAERRAR